MPAVHSTAVTFVAHPTMRELERVIKNPFLKTLFRGAISSLLLDYAFNPLDIVPHLNIGLTTYSLEPRIATTLWTNILKIAQVIHCSALDFNPYTTSEPLPVAIPYDRFRALTLHAPVISLALQAPHRNPLLDEFLTIEEVQERVARVQHFGHYYIRWIGSGIERAVALGENAKGWNWGAYWGLSWEEFLEHVEAHTPVRKVPLPTYDSAAINHSLALILHPTHSHAARRATNILAGHIPTESRGRVALPIGLADTPFYTRFTDLFI
ncbi:hypothetical protein FPV67DRAFT_1674467 [Lyophyllum atratum]|nr:hypothetical protein FPV67DRAFT_1674467 [Lyophyllum atratum]